MTGLPFTGTGISKLQNARGTQQRHNHTNGHHKVPLNQWVAWLFSGRFFVDLSGGGVRKQKGEDSSRNNGCCVGGTTQQLVLKNQEVDSKNFEGLYNISHVFVKN